MVVDGSGQVYHIDTDGKITEGGQIDRGGATTSNNVEGDSSLSNLEATFKMFNMANDALHNMGEDPLFETHLVGSRKRARMSNGCFRTLKGYR